MLDSHLLPDGYVDTCLRTYAPHPEIDEARTKLEKHRVVVLVGEPGTGRHTAAVWLLSKIGGLTLREVRREPDDAFVANDLATEHAVGWLLDLRGEDDKVALNFGRTLATCTEMLAAADTASYLAVAIRPDLWKQVGAGGDALQVWIEKADPRMVVERRLLDGESSMSQSDVDEWLRHDDISRHLVPLTPKAAVEWAAAIRSEHYAAVPDSVAPDAAPDKVLHAKVENVIRARSSWHADLLAWHKEHTESRRRNFLLAAAVLENATAGEVFLAGETLAEFFGETESRQPGHQGPGIHELVADAGAHLDSSGAVRFSRTGYADSVLEYFWTDRMHLQKTFLGWLSARLLDRGGAFAEGLADRIGRFVLRWTVQHGSLEMLRQVVAAWAADKKLAPTAETLLTAAGLDDTIGKATRDELLAWAKSEDASAEVKTVVARVCGGELGFMYPKLMLYRLGRLAGTADPHVAAAIKESVGSLWQHPRTRPFLRKEISAWCRADDTLRRNIGRRTFSALACLPSDIDGSPLVAFPDGADSDRQIDQEEQEFLTLGWRTVLEAPSEDEAEPLTALALMLDAALSSPSAQAVVVRLMISAIGTPPGKEDIEFNARRAVVLTSLLYAWQPRGGPPTPEKDLRDLLIDRTNKLDPVWRTPAHLPGTTGDA